MLMWIVSYRSLYALNRMCVGA